MRKTHLIIILVALFFGSNCNSQTDSNAQSSVPTNEKRDIRQNKAEKPPAKIGEIPLPPDYKRIAAQENDMTAFLRNLDLKTEDNIVYLYNGKPKGIQSSQYAVLTTDVGTRDLQQCADAVMRLRAEYLYEQKNYQAIHFNFLSDGKPRHYTNYAKGDYSRKKFRKYMDYIFAYANTASLKKELKKVDNPQNIRPGDLFIQTGNPYGHAVTVMDLAEDDSGNLIFLLSQSYMPAQDIHILNNPANKSLSPWYEVKTAGEIQTPEWTFNWSDLMRFPE